MAQPPTYVQLLAEVYEETAKSNLVYQQEFENEHAEPYEDEDYSDNELDDRDDFNKFHGNRGKPEHVIKPKPKDDPAGKSSYNIDRHIRTYAINIDGRFRGGIVLQPNNTCNSNSLEFSGTDPALFAFNPSRQYKNVHSIKITSLEFYNSFNTFSAVSPVTGLGRGNTTFTISDYGPTNTTPALVASYPITIQDGNYVMVDPEVTSGIKNNLLELLRTRIQTLTVANGNTLVFPDMRVTLNTNTNFVTFMSLAKQFRLDFPISEDNPYGNGIGYNLGFTSFSYPSTYEILVAGNAAQVTSLAISDNVVQAECQFDAVQDTYIYLKINDWYIINHLNSKQNEFGAFIKIPLTSPKNTIQFMSSTTNTTAREYLFPQPTNVSSFLFEMVDAYGRTLDMKGSTFSLTLEIQEILQSDIYQKMLEL